MTAQKAESDCTRCQIPAHVDAITIGNEEEYRGNACAPIIDAEKSNEALRMVALIRNHTGPGDMAFSAE